MNRKRTAGRVFIVFSLSLMDAQASLVPRYVVGNGGRPFRIAGREWLFSSRLTPR
jgi:hypothetical protein